MCLKLNDFTTDGLALYTYRKQYTGTANSMHSSKQINTRLSKCIIMHIFFPIMYKPTDKKQEHNYEVGRNAE